MAIAKILPIQALDRVQMNSLVDLHMQTMPTLLTDLGRSFVEKYYQQGQAAQGAIGLVGLNESGDLIGWVFGSSDPSRLNKKLAIPLTWFLFHIIAVFFHSPKVILSLMKSLKPNPNNDIKHGQFELTYIGINPTYQHQGVGQQLIENFIQRAKIGGFTQVVLSVETDNINAISLYKKINFEITNTFSEGFYHRHRMVLNLD